MRYFKFSAGIACGIITLLITWILHDENPEMVLYENTIHTLMEQEDMSSYQEVERCYPLLARVKANLTQITKLQQTILGQGRSPAPAISTGKARQMKHQQQVIKELRQQIKVDLSQFLLLDTTGSNLTTTNP